MTIARHTLSHCAGISLVACQAELRNIDFLAASEDETKRVQGCDRSGFFAGPCLGYELIKIDGELDSVRELPELASLDGIDPKLRGGPQNLKFRGVVGLVWNDVAVRQFQLHSLHIGCNWVSIWVAEAIYSANLQQGMFSLRSVVSRDNPAASSLLCREYSLPKLLEQTSRQHPVVIRAIWSRTKVIAWPRESVQFVVADPVPPIVQTEAAADADRDLERRGGIHRRAMRDGCNDRSDASTLVARNSDHDRAGSVL